MTADDATDATGVASAAMDNVGDRKSWKNKIVWLSRAR